jgi:protein CpxP
MRKVTAAVMASTLAFSALSQAAGVITGDNKPSSEGITQHSSQSHMFDGISLTVTGPP